MQAKPRLDEVSMHAHEAYSFTDASDPGYIELSEQSGICVFQNNFYSLARLIYRTLIRD